MIQTKQKCIAAAISALAASGGAFAAGLGAPAADLSGTVTPIKYASEIATATVAFGGLQVGWKSPSNYNVNAANPYYVKIALTSGAKFKTAPDVYCAMAGDATTAVLGATAGSGIMAAASAKALALNAGGGAGSTSGTWQLQSGFTLKGGYCWLTAKSATISSRASQTLSAVQEYKNGLSNAIVGKAGTVVTFTKATTATVTRPTTAIQLDVSQATKVFVVNQNRTVTNAALGTVFMSGIGIKNAAGVAVSAGDLIKTGTVVVSGAPVPTFKYGASAASGLAANGFGVFLASAGSCAAAKAIASEGTYSGNKVTFKLTKAQAVKMSAASGISVCLNTKTVAGGASAKADGAVYVTFTSTANAAFSTVNGLSSTALLSVGKNGSTRRVFNIPAANNTADAGYVRITNTSASVAGKIYVTLIDQDGATIGTASSALNGGATLAAGATLVVDAATLKAAVGATSDWTGRARAVITGETDAMEVMGLVRNATSGNLNNMSSVAPQ